MSDKCFICSIDLSNINLTVDANHINNIETWREYFEKNPYKFYFAKVNASTCVECFKTLSSWKIFPNKIKFLRDRQLTGVKPKLKFPLPVELEKCVSCKKRTPYSVHTSVYFRDFYITGMGQYCEECFNKVTQDRLIMRESYLNYLF